MWSEDRRDQRFAAQASSTRERQMRDASEILKYIEERYERMLARPHMYAGSPAMLEAILTTLEEVREFLITDDDRLTNLDGYSSFLLAKGFGAIGFTGREFEKTHQAHMDATAFRPFCDFWKEFLATEQRTQPKA